MNHSFTARDLDGLKAAGISPALAQNQLRLLRQGSKPPRLLRPCALGDGIRALSQEAIEDLAPEGKRAFFEGRVVHFLPASGAASRMADSFRELRRQGEVPDALAALFNGHEEDLASMPKALVPFHRRGSRAVTPVEEHIREAIALAGSGGSARLHFTLAPEHEERILEHVRAVLAVLADEGLRAEVTHSLQTPATQTLALDESGEPFRDASGDLLLRPGGHGALLGNLESCGAEFAWIRNIDNIPVESIRAQGRRIRQAMVGKAIRLAKDPKRERPLRVCGMVPDSGEPGGGPFWVATGQGESLRIVETVETDRKDAEQARIFRSSTHFNPTDMVCALRDPEGRPFRLADFADAEACFIARKSHEGRPLRALEWPGLWNGGMAGWITEAVEIPLAQFAPVKTALDLLRPEHMGF
jgi:hypothetical protein